MVPRSISGHLDGIKALLRDLAGENPWKLAFLFNAEPSLWSFERARQPALSLRTTGWDRVGNASGAWPF